MDERRGPETKPTSFPSVGAQEPAAIGRGAAAAAARQARLQAGAAAVARITGAPSGAGALVSPGASVLSGALVASNNPEAVYSPGKLLAGCRVGPGRVDVYVHHANHTGAALDFFLLVRPAGPAPLHESSAGTSHGGTVNQVRAADPNYETARDAIALGEKPLPAAATVGAARAIAIGSLPRSPDRHSADASPLLDAREVLALDGPALVDVVCRARGDGTDLAALPLATGNTKLATAGTAGRAAGVYRGALWQDARTFDVTHLERPIVYPLTASGGQPAPAPEALQRKESVTVPRGELTALLAKSPGADAATLALLGRCYGVSTAWLADAGVARAGRIDPAAKLFDRDPSFRVLVLGLQGAVAADLAARGPAARTAAFLDENRAIGAATDAADYGTIYELAFTLTNGGKAAVHLGLFLDNRVPSPYRGAVEVTTPAGTARLSLFRDSASAGGSAGRSPLGTIAVPPAAADGHPGSAPLRVRLMSPGQISSGQSLELGP